MADPTLTVVLPTVGRPTLARAVLSLMTQDWGPGDSVLVAGDGRVDQAREFCSMLVNRMPIRYVETPARFGNWGHGVRNWVRDQRLLFTSHVMFLDDDDAYLPGAAALVRRAVRAAPNAPHVFRMNWVSPAGDREVLWRTPDLVEGNVGTPCFVVPNDPQKMGRWGDRYAGDFDFIKETCSRYPTGPVWGAEVICVSRPHMEDVRV